MYSKDSKDSRSIFSKILIVVLVGFIWLLFAEIVARLVLPRPGYHPFPNEEVVGIKTHHPIRGFAFKPNFSGRRITEDFNHAVTTNSLGLREKEIHLDNLEEVRLLAVGNSFTEGLGVEYIDAWPSQLEILIKSDLNSPLNKKVRVINAGISAYSLRQIRMMSEELIPLLNPLMLLVGVFVEGYDRIDNPYVYLNKTTVRRSEIPRLMPIKDGFLYSSFYKEWAIGLDFWLDQNFYIGAHFAKTIQRMRSTSNIVYEKKTEELTFKQAKTNLNNLLEEINAIKSVAEKNKVELIILFINRQSKNGEFKNAAINNKIIREYCQAKEIYFVDPLSKLTNTSAGKPIFRFKNDGHWTSDAHKIAAESIFDLIDKKNILR